METYSNLTLCALDREGNARTCNYWYVVQNNHGPHTAFRTKSALLSWLDAMNLKLKDTESSDIPDPDTKHAFFWIEGTYNRMRHASSGSLAAVNGTNCRVLENGDYRPGKISVDPNGIRTLHVLHAMADHTPFHYEESRALHDAGGEAY